MEKMSRYAEICELMGLTMDGKPFTTSLENIPGWTVIFKHEEGSEGVTIVAMNNKSYGTVQVPDSENLTISDELEKLGKLLANIEERS